MPSVTVTGPFKRDLKRLAKQDGESVITALQTFIETPDAKDLNFEAVVSRAGYFSIRATYKVRVLLKRVGGDCYDAVAVGNHDYVYASYFKK